MCRSSSSCPSPLVSSPPLPFVYSEEQGKTIRGLWTSGCNCMLDLDGRWDRQGESRRPRASGHCCCPVGPCRCLAGQVSWVARAGRMPTSPVTAEGCGHKEAPFLLHWPVLAKGCAAGPNLKAMGEVWISHKTRWLPCTLMGHCYNWHQHLQQWSIR